jgi:putative phage-type endonuclease
MTSDNIETVGQLLDALPHRETPTLQRFKIESRGEWLKWRKQDVTASEIAALFGCHPYRTMLDVFASKVGEGGDQGDNPAMRRGRVMEPAVAAAVAEERPAWRLEKSQHYYRDTLARLGATPDYYIHGEKRGLGLLECKTVAPEKFDEWNGGPPLAYTLQTLVQMMLTKAAWGVIGVIVMNRSLDLHLFDVPRHPAAEEKIQDKCAEFWSRVQRNEMPPPNYALDHAAISALYPRDSGEVLDLTTDNRIAELIANRDRLKTTEKDAETALDAIDAEIKAKLGDASVAMIAGGRQITWKTQHRKETIIAAKDIRVLRISKAKGE